MGSDSGKSACAGCARCEALPEAASGAGQLYVWLPLGHSAGKVRRLLARRGLEHEAVDERCVRVALDADGQERLAAALGGALTEQESADTLVLRMEGGGPPRLADVPRAMPLTRFLGLAQGDWLLDLLRDERLTSHFQPIVRAEDTSDVFAQEALLRGLAPDGALIPPDKVFGAARDAGLLFQLDLAARRGAIRAAGRHGIGSRVFINFNPTAIYDPEFCLRSTVQAVQETGLEPARVVFEIIESDRHQDTAHLRRIMDFYRGAGFQIALDDMGAGYSSLNLIHQLRPDYVKLDMELMRGVHEDPYKAMVVQKMLEIAQALGIETVAEGVECLEELEWARAHGATYIQGYLVAKPSAAPVTATPRLGPARLRLAA